MKGLRLKRLLRRSRRVELLVVVAMLTVFAIIEIPHYAAYIATTYAVPSIQAYPTSAGVPRLTCTTGGSSTPGTGGDDDGGNGKAHQGTGATERNP